LQTQDVPSLTISAGHDAPHVLVWVLKMNPGLHVRQVPRV